MKLQPTLRTSVCAISLGLSIAAHAQPQDASLAQELTNPLADLVTVPIQMSFDRDIGPTGGGKKVTTKMCNPSSHSIRARTGT